MKIVVLAGGISTERDVSLSSGRGVYNALKERGHQVILLDVFLGYEGDPGNIFELDRDWVKDVAPVSEVAPDIEKIKASRKKPSKCILPASLLINQKCRAVRHVLIYRNKSPVQ